MYESIFGLQNRRYCTCV